MSASQPSKARAVGPYSRPCVLAKLDQRTKEARLLRETRDALVEHIGGQPSAVQGALIERSVWLSLGVAQLDAKMANGAAFTQHDHNSYIAWSNALSRTLGLLGLQPTAAKPPTLAEQLAADTRRRQEAAA
jgi:hypothetical protein